MRKHNTSRKYIEEISKYKIKCPYCGHVMILIKQKNVICQWCGHKVYKDKKDEFKDKYLK